MAGAAAVTFNVIASGKGIYHMYNDFCMEQGGQFNLTFGLRKKGHVLLYEESASPCSRPGYQTTQFTYQRRRNEVITYVEAKDNRGDGTGGSPKRISGGPGHDHVTVEVTSQLFRGFDFTFSVYGKRRWYYALKR